MSSTGASWARERRTSSIADACSRAQLLEREQRVRGDVDAERAQVVLERLDEVGVDRDGAAVRLGGRQPAERAHRVRVPVDVEPEARLADALGEHERGGRGLLADLQRRGAAQGARVQARAREVEQLGRRPPA